MLLNIEKSMELDRSAEEVWSVVRTPETVAGCVPKVEDFLQSGLDAYEATVADKLGPFSLQIPVSIEVEEAEGESRIVARISGSDKLGQAIVRGQVEAAVEAEDESSKLLIIANVEVLGRMATLGAVPMRRRADQIFTQFADNLEQLLVGRRPQRGLTLVWMRVKGWATALFGRMLPGRRADSDPGRKLDDQ